MAIGTKAITPESVHHIEILRNKGFKVYRHKDFFEVECKGFYEEWIDLLTPEGVEKMRQLIDEGYLFTGNTPIITIPEIQNNFEGFCRVSHRENLGPKLRAFVVNPPLETPIKRLDPIEEAERRILG